MFHTGELLRELSWFTGFSGLLLAVADISNDLRPDHVEAEVDVTGPNGLRRLLLIPAGFRAKKKLKNKLYNS